MKISSIEQLKDSLWSYRISQAIFTAFEINVFKQLAKKGYTQTKLSEKLQVSERGLEPLLDTLVSMQILELKQNKYRLPSHLKDYLSPESEQYIGNLVSHEIHLSNRWKNLTRSVVTGKPAKDKSKSPQQSDVSRFVRAMSTVGQQSAQLLCDTIPFKANEHILDLGGGPGQYQKLLCEKHQNIVVTLFDQDESVKMAREDHKNHLAANRMKYITGDLFVEDLQGKYDTILISNVIHIYGPDEIVEILERCFKNLKDDGRVLIKDFIITDETRQLPFTHLFALHMLLSTETGRCYRDQEIESFYNKTGFRLGQKYQLTETSMVVEGIKQ
jgi:3-hydroxy-5-methyl-1-naphthoate 3-O-methyltransferase